MNKFKVGDKVRSNYSEYLVNQTNNKFTLISKVLFKGASSRSVVIIHNKQFARDLKAELNRKTDNRYDIHLIRRKEFGGYSILTSRNSWREINPNLYEYLSRYKTTHFYVDTVMYVLIKEFLSQK